MEFVEQVLKELNPLIRRNNLILLEKTNDYLKLATEYLLITIAHNRLENSNLLFLGRHETTPHIEIGNEVLKSVFRSQLKLENVSTGQFVVNLVLFFENEGMALLKGEEDKMAELERFNFARSQAYTADLILRQSLETAEKFWITKDYNRFVKLIEQIDVSKLPISFKRKYKIASTAIRSN